MELIHLLNYFFQAGLLVAEVCTIAVFIVFVIVEAVRAIRRILGSSPTRQNEPAIVPTVVSASTTALRRSRRGG